jgi:type IV pilus assembly protein PilA
METRRLRTGEGDDGFTLIELLVVIIIIGILAAIALPSFLNQRNKGYDAQAKSDLHNAGIAEETYLTDNFAYTTNPADLVSIGWNPSEGNLSLFVISISNSSSNDAAGTYCISETSKSGRKFYYNSASGGVSATPCT